MDEANRSSFTTRKMTHDLPPMPLHHTEKENDGTPPTTRSSLPSTSSPTRKSKDALLVPFQPLVFDVATSASNGYTASQCRSSNDRNVVTPSPLRNGPTSPKTKSSSSSSSTEYLSESSLRSASPVSSTTFPTTSTTTPSSCGAVDIPSPMALKFTSLTTCDVRQPISTTTSTNATSNSIELILQRYPKELWSTDSSKITKMQQLVMSLTTNSNETDSSIAAIEIAHLLMTDMMQLHQMLIGAEHCITELQKGYNPSVCLGKSANEECESNAL